VSGPSEVVGHGAFPWKTTEWHGRPWQDAAILELHIGTFTPEGTFRAAIDKLDHVAKTGFTAIELMPLAAFGGRRNWGYDGVLLYAPNAAYGRPDDLKALVDAAHARGLMVLLDVVYNHFGPEGNYLARYAPAFFTSAHTPWGNAIDYRVREVRSFAIENALHWLRHYRFDGLRLDAAHAIVLPGEPSLLNALSAAVGGLAADSGRTIHLVLENDDNTASLLDPGEEPPRGRYRAQWNDDYHHAWHTMLTGERGGYYKDYEAAPLDHLARALSAGFAYQGESSAHRSGRPRGEPSGTLSPLAFINFVQNHDQIGNRPLGDRLITQVDEVAMEAALAITLLAPMPPLMFMGDEWGSRRPFPFFCDFHGELAHAVRCGRRREFAHGYAEFGDAISDPLAEETFRSAVLDWSAHAELRHRQRLELVRRLLALRLHEIVPRLGGVRFGSACHDAGVLTADWTMGDASLLALVANLSSQATTGPDAPPTARALWNGDRPRWLPPWSAYWTLGAA
jgi:maltooligosyltrehalose trehalohydrolase